MNIAFTAKGTDWKDAMDPRFGRADYILVYNEAEDTFSSFDNRAISGTAHGAGPQTAQQLFEMNPDVLITGNGPGGNAAAALQRSQMKIFIGAGSMTVREAYEAYKAGKLNQA